MEELEGQGHRQGVGVALVIRDGFTGFDETWARFVGLACHRQEEQGEQGVGEDDEEEDAVNPGPDDRGQAGEADVEEDDGEFSKGGGYVEHDGSNPSEL